ncbi:hypothetical protein E2C01_091888 [Portunus trituberculatus]|uniref:Uncharacterized protein n=1 Tax=Portunus trituberculatus TaxID=210409 RepID=A0A5B7JP75_PORTR|nr:hypothetical protein [Portunus trituberculatus]
MNLLVDAVTTSSKRIKRSPAPNPAQHSPAQPSPVQPRPPLESCTLDPHPSEKEGNPIQISTPGQLLSRAGLTDKRGL